MHLAKTTWYTRGRRDWAKLSLMLDYGCPGAQIYWEHLGCRSLEPASTVELIDKARGMQPQGVSYTDILPLSFLQG